MNAGLSNLSTLKAWLLTAAMRSGTDYDDDIAAIGRGVALQIEKACNRKLERVVGDACIVTGPRESIVVPRYPLEAVSSVETRTDQGDDWAAENSAIVEYWHAQSGLVRFAAGLGTSERVQIRVTYTGGLWWEQLEPDDEEYPTAQPEGAAALDPDLLLAWLLQCEHVWAQRDKLGLAIAERPSAESALARIALLPAVREMLQPFVRYSLL